MYYVHIQYEASIYDIMYVLYPYIVVNIKINRIDNVVTLETFMDFCIREDHLDKPT